MSIQKIQVPVQFAHQQRNNLVAAAMNKAPLPEALTKIIFEYVQGVEKREFVEACLIHDSLHKRLSYCASSVSCFPKEDGKKVVKMKNEEARLWREMHYMFIYIPTTIKEYLTKIGPMVVHLKKMENYVVYYQEEVKMKVQLKFDINDF